MYQSFADFIGQGIGVSILVVAAAIIIWRKIAAASPEIGNAATELAKKKVLDQLTKWMK